MKSNAIQPPPKTNPKIIIDYIDQIAKKVLQMLKEDNTEIVDALLETTYVNNKIDIKVMKCLAQYEDSRDK